MRWNQGSKSHKLRHKWKFELPFYGYFGRQKVAQLSVLETQIYGLGVEKETVMKSIENAFFDDHALAVTLSLSPSWVRGQRYKRRKGLPHTLDIDPVMIGSSPRYRIEDVEAFIKGLIPANQNGGQSNG